MFSASASIAHWLQRAYGMALATIVSGEVLIGSLMLQLPPAARLASVDLLIGIVLSAVVLGVGAWGIASFTKFKDEATKQATDDRASATQALVDAKMEFNQELAEIKAKVERIDERFVSFDDKLASLVAAHDSERSKMLDYILRGRDHNHV